MLLPVGDKGFNAALKGASGKEDVVLALEASDSYICPDPYHLPLVTPAGVAFLEADDVTQPYLHDHLLTSK
jgi:hypothetical protein